MTAATKPLPPPTVVAALATTPQRQQRRHRSRLSPCRAAPAAVGFDTVGDGFVDALDTNRDGQVRCCRAPLNAVLPLAPVLLVPRLLLAIARLTLSVRSLDAFSHTPLTRALTRTHTPLTLTHSRTHTRSIQF